MRVLVLSSNYPRESNPVSGVFIHQQVRHIVQQGVDCVVVCPTPYVPSFLASKSRWRNFLLTPHSSTIDGVSISYPRYIRPPGKLFHAPSGYSLRFALSQFMRDLVTDFQPDLIHAHMATPHGFAALRLAEDLGLPLVVSLRGSDIHTYPDWDRLTSRQTELVMAQADQLTAVSHYLRKAAEAIATPRTPIHLIYTGCDTHKFVYNAQVRIAARRQLEITDEKVLVMFIGRLQRSKGAFDLLDALSIAAKTDDRLQGVFVGTGRDHNELSKRVVQLRLSERVKFIGAQPHEEIPDLLSAADILALPSWREGLPNVILEAMACERPVVAYGVGGIPEAVTHEKAGLLVQRGDVEELAGAIVRMSKDRSTRMSMGASGRRTVINRFTWERNARDIGHVYERAVREFDND